MILFPLRDQSGSLQNGQLRQRARAFDLLDLLPFLVHKDPRSRAVRGHHVVIGLEDCNSGDVAGINGERDLAQQSALRTQGNDPAIPVIDQDDIPIAVQRHRPNRAYLARTTSLASP